MEITICGSMRFMEVMRTMSSWLKRYGVREVKIPEDVRPKSLHDEDFTSVLIKRRADHIISIGESDLVIVVCEPYEGRNKPRLIHSSMSADRGFDYSIRTLNTADEIPEFIKSWALAPTEKNALDVYGCTLGYNIGESTSFELITALDVGNPVLIVPISEAPCDLTPSPLPFLQKQGHQWVCHPDMMKVEPDDVYLCNTF